LSSYCAHRDLHPFPTRRSSDLRDLSIPGATLHQPKSATAHPCKRARLDAAADAAAGVSLLALRLQREESVQLPRPLVRVEHQSRSEEHTSELQSRFDLVCRLLL